MRAGVAKAFQNKEYGQVFERAAISLAEFAPTMAMAILNPFSAGGVSGISSGFEKIQSSHPGESRR